jgi:hypothetical protein
MDRLTRRAVFGLGLAGACIPSIALFYSALADSYGPQGGKEVALGVHRVDLGKGEAIIPESKIVTLFDLVFQPFSILPNGVAMGDMICHVTAGRLWIVQNGWGFWAAKNHVWTRSKGLSEEARNEGSDVAVLRVTELLPA